MFNIDKIDTVYIACGFTDLRKSIDGLIMIVKNELKLDPFERALFVFCNKQMNRIKILHFDERFWSYYHRLKNGRMPLARMEIYFQMMNLKLSKQTLSNWIFKRFFWISAN